jgi:hypothetical protein
MDDPKGALHLEPRATKNIPKKIKEKYPSDRVGSFVVRTRPQELAVIKAIVESTKHAGEEAIHEILVDSLTRHPWVATYFRIAYDYNRKYRLKSYYLEDYLPPKKKPGIPISLFVLLTKLQFSQLSATDAAYEWWGMLQYLPEELHDVANMLLDKKLGVLTRKQCNAALKATNNFPLIRKKSDAD